MSIKSMPVWKWVLLLIASFVLALLMYAGAQMAGDISAIDWVDWIIAIAVSAAMIALYAVFVKWFEKHPARDIPRSKLVGDTAKGLAVGGGFMAAVVLVMMAFGLYRITGAGTDRPLAIISAFFLFLYVGVGEEILFRGVLFRWIDEKWGFVAALTVSALLFGAMHYGQPGATWWSSLAIAIEAGLLLGAAYKYSGTLWFPSASTGRGISSRATSSASRFPAATPGNPSSRRPSTVPTASPAARSAPKLPSSPSSWGWASRSGTCGAST